jgi:hypothetical protein
VKDQLANRRGRLYEKPTDFLRSIAIHPRAHRARNELSTQADTQNSLPGLYAGTNELLLLNEPGKLILIVDTHGAAHHDEQIYFV